MAVPPLASVTSAGLKPMTSPDGNDTPVSETFPSNPFRLVTVIVAVRLEPALIKRNGRSDETVKLGGGGKGVTSTTIVIE